MKSLIFGPEQLMARSCASLEMQTEPICHWFGVDGSIYCVPTSVHVMECDVSIPRPRAPSLSVYNIQRVTRYVILNV